jgi:hypothetical protein
MRLGPLRETCAQPAPKSRLAVTEPFVVEEQRQIKSRSKADQKQIKSRSKADQKQIKGFPAEAGPTDCTRCFCGTYWSRSHGHGACF